MNLPPLVSIVVPIYNVEKYLGRCLDSLLGQSLKDIEILCVDDGSTDEGPEILAHYATVDSRVKIVHQSNQGVSAARNAALEQIEGRYTIFVDPDDWLEPQTCALATGLMEADPDLDYVCWSSRIIYDGVERPSPSEVSKFEAMYRVKYKGRRAVSRKIKLNTVPNVCNKMLKTVMIKDFGLTFPPQPLGEDGGFWYKFVAHAHYGYYLDEPLYNYYRGRSDSATRNRTLPEFNWLSIFDDLYSHYERFGLLNEAERIFLSTVFIRWYRKDLWVAHNHQAVRDRAGQMARALDLPNLPGNIIKFLKEGRDQEWADYNYRLIERIFSIKNRDQAKVITILGLEIKLRKREK